MPHKHKRNETKSDISYYDLPPSKFAQPLPTTKPSAKTTANTTTKPLADKPSNKKRRRTQNDDTPRAFTRLLSAYLPPRAGLDDGLRPSKKRKNQPPSDLPAPVSTIPAPTIQHNEPLSAFAARVDAALPFSGISKKRGGAERKTKTERKMQRMQKEWREEDKRRKESAEEGKNGGQDGEVDEEGVVERKRKKKGKKKRGGGGNGSHNDDDDENDDDDDDPWAGLAAKRREAEGNGGGGLVGLHDVVQAPPRFLKGPGRGDRLEIGKGRGLKKQVELSEARRSVVEGYRQMMRGKRGYI